MPSDNYIACCNCQNFPIRPVPDHLTYPVKKDIYRTAVFLTTLGRTMQVTIGSALLELVEGDITQQKVDAIVNAANTTLLGGGGVDGAIHRAGGPAILEECKKIGGCPTGEAVITSGGNLPAKWVIHTVGPVWRDGSNREDTLLRNAYKNSLIQADLQQLESIAFPSISTGAYRFPIEKAAHIALSTIAKHLKGKTTVKTVCFVLFGTAALEAYRNSLQDLCRKDKEIQQV
jgi:O-acetyl-ADP-ribose deacetylase (regulator of RNase III)